MPWEAHLDELRREVAQHLGGEGRRGGVEEQVLAQLRLVPAHVVHPLRALRQHLADVQRRPHPHDADPDAVVREVADGVVDVAGVDGVGEHGLNICHSDF